MHTRAKIVILNVKNNDVKIKTIFQKCFFRSRAAWIILYFNSQASTFSQTDSRKKSKIRLFIFFQKPKIFKNILIFSYWNRMIISAPGYFFNFFARICDFLVFLCWHAALLVLTLCRLPLSFIKDTRIFICPIS